MNFLLIWEWFDDGYLREQNVDFFETKEELLEAKKDAQETFKVQVDIGNLMLSAGVHYCWADIDRLF